MTDTPSPEALQVAERLLPTAYASTIVTKYRDDTLPTVAQELQKWMDRVKELEGALEAMAVGKPLAAAYIFARNRITTLEAEVAILRAVIKTGGENAAV